ncbi:MULTISPECIES: SDR family oxidoreductase [unclassified Leifsonia]|uniref:SDR family oxidoreductase n=1 Tax=unclassified Leifsonia TaxID=2663824 RepID=UPI0006F341A3|nr:MULTISPECIES: NAD(P)H-binding protein [unclassified Leifsonia]KQX07680.1 3-beta hydroxysteroid dehydrogenase [Leifsonia sp. Root1293]KRA11962.1 3-beta hydroxysteroid dehydrogenase [Leifsonia sp. Root60]
MRIAVAGGTGAVGRHVADIARARGHDVVVLSRSTGMDLTTGHGLPEALAGTETVIDVASIATQSEKRSRTFFGDVTRNLLKGEEDAGVRHHIALSIVGSDKAPFGYYAGKELQEQLVSESRIPWTIQRATQFHEFAQQLYGQITLGPINLVPKMLSQPIAAREVAERLVTQAEEHIIGRPADLAGPEVLRMVDMVKAYAVATHATGPIVEVPLPGGFGKAMRDGTLTAGPGADLGTETYGDWLATIART